MSIVCPNILSINILTRISMFMIQVFNERNFNSILKCCLMVLTFGWKLMIFFLFFAKHEMNNMIRHVRKRNKQSNQAKQKEKKRQKVVKIKNIHGWVCDQRTQDHIDWKKSYLNPSTKQKTVNRQIDFQALSSISIDLGIDGTHRFCQFPSKTVYTVQLIID